MSLRTSPRLSELVRLIASAIGAALSLGGAAAQGSYVGIEPNQTKAEATLVAGIGPGDVITTSFPFPSYFRIRPADAPLRVYRYELWPFTNMGSMDLRGRTALQDAVDPASDVALATLGTQSTFDAFLAWYGFGKSEEVLARIELATCSQGRFPVCLPSSTDLVVTAANERDLGAVAEQPLELVARPLTGTPDLELHVFDAEFNALPYAALDASTLGSLDVRLPFEAPPGLYHIAVTDHEAATHLPPSALDYVTSSTVLDFAGGFVCSSNARLFEVELAIEPAGGGAPLARGTATKLLAYEALWFRVQVGQGQSFQSYCHADGTVFACCLGAPPRRSGMGCVNSSGRGGTTLALDHLQPGQWRVTLEDLPPSTFALGFVGLQAAAPAQSLGGLSCIAPGAVRVGPVQADPAGTAVVATYDPTSGGFLAGQTLYLQAAYRDAAAPAGCTVNFTSGFAFVAR